MKNIPAVISEVVLNDFCVGCGVCVVECKSSTLTMTWDENGFRIPEDKHQNCAGCGICLKVCPFEIKPSENVRDNTMISNCFFNDSKFKTHEIGRFESLFVGYSKKYRLTSSSGGIATYLQDKLFRNKIVDHIISVQEFDDSKGLFQYTIISNKENLILGSKTKYYPVEMSEVLMEIKSLPGSVCVVGVGCFIKAIRKLQLENSYFKNKIKFCIGIICGGCKSRFYTDYLVGYTGSLVAESSDYQYRVKDISSKSIDYSFSCYNKKQSLVKSYKMRELGDMWGTGLFKANVCDFCDDVTSELADVSLGDAWIAPYNLSGKGNSVIVVRNKLAEKLISDGCVQNELNLSELSVVELMRSQGGNFRHRHDGIRFRQKYFTKNGCYPPSKDYKPNNSILFILILILRRGIQKWSFRFWKRNPNSQKFKKRTKLPFLLLKGLNKVNHIIYAKRFSK